MRPATDYQILMAYDEHFEEGEPGAIASQGWFVDTLSQRMRELDPAKTIIAIGNYAYDWSGQPSAVDMTFQEAVLASKESEAPITFDPATLNPHFDYREDDGSTHHVWFLDAVTAQNQIRAADVFRPKGYALWRLGSEDPSIWSLFGRPYNAAIPEALKTIVARQRRRYRRRGRDHSILPPSRRAGRGPSRPTTADHLITSETLHQNSELVRHPPLGLGARARSR